MKKLILTTLGVITLLISINSCKKKDIAPDVTQTIQTPIQDTTTIPTNTIVVTPTLAVNENTISIKYDIQTISGSYAGNMVPTYYGQYKVSLMVYKNGVYSSQQPSAVTLDCTCNPRTIVLNGFKKGDVVSIYWNLIQTGSTNHNGLPSIFYSYQQKTDPSIQYEPQYNSGGPVLQSKQGYTTHTIL